MNSIWENTHCFKTFTSSPISYGFTPVEGSSVVDVQVCVSTQSVNTNVGECKVSALAVFTVIYENDEGFYREESSATLDIVFNNDKIGNNSPIAIAHNATDVKVNQSGDEFVITAIIDSEADFLSFNECNYLSDIEEGICKTTDIEGLTKLSAFSEITDFDGEKECPFEIKTMLCHDEHVRILSCTAGVNRVFIGGEIDCEFLVVSKKGEPMREYLTVPFRYEAECDDCLPEYKVIAGGSVVSATYRVENDERRSTVSSVISVDFNFCVFKKCGYKAIIDAFAKNNELNLIKEELPFTCDVGNRELKYKCFGEASCSKSDVYILGVTGTSVTAFDYRTEDGKLNLNGVVFGDLLVKDKDGKVSSAIAEMPFTCQFDYDGLPVGVGCDVVKFSAKDLDGKCVAECELYFNTQYYKNDKISVVTAFEVGESKKADDCAVRIIFVEKGDECWTVCKKVGVSEEELHKQNPELIFPAERDSGIVIYRKI